MDDQSKRGDVFGISAGIIAAARVYFRSARQTGRTQALIEALKTGDRVIVSSLESARRIERGARKRGVTVTCFIGADPERISPCNVVGSRTIFDHEYLEVLYMAAIVRVEREVAETEFRLRGPDIEEMILKDNRRAREHAKWDGME